MTPDLLYEIAGGALIGLSLGLLGAGGSIITVPILVYLLHHDGKVAVAESLAIVGGIALVSGLRQAAKGLVRWRHVFLFGVPGVVGAYAGAKAAEYIAAFVQLLLLAVVMIAAGVLMIRGKTIVRTEEGSPPRQAGWMIALQGAGVGVLSGVVGIGGGFLIVPALVLAGGLPMHLAVATSLLVIAMNSGSGLARHWMTLHSHGQTMDLSAVWIFLGFGIAGGLVGGSLSQRIAQAKLRRAFGWLLLVVAVYVICREGPKLLG